MSLRFLPANHLLLVENGLQEFDDAGSVLAMVDDHALAAAQPEPRLIAITLPARNPELERWIPRIREHSLSDAFEAMRKVLLDRGIPETTADRFVDDARTLAERERVPVGWTAWAEIPPGSLSAFGDGQWLLRWPEADVRRLDAARFEYVVVEVAHLCAGPEFTFASGRPSVPWVRVYRSGLTTEQIQAFLAAPVLPHKTPADVFEQMFPVSEVAGQKLA